MLRISEHVHAVHETTDQCQESKYEEYNSQDPNDWRLEELYDDDEAQRNQDQPEIEKQHEATDALGVRAEGIRCRHGLHDDAAFPRRVRFHRRGARSARAVAVMTRRSLVQSRAWC